MRDKSIIWFKIDHDSHPFLYFQVSALGEGRQLLYQELGGSLHLFLIPSILQLGQEAAVQFQDVLHIDAL